jgi:cell division protein FtsI/penicillin-binding protein 2
LFVIQIVNGKSLQQRATNQWTRDLVMTAPRGKILDRTGATLAVSYTTYNVYVRSREVEFKSETSQAAVAGIKSKISKLGDILAADKAKLKSLNNQIYRANKQNTELKNFVASLESRIAEQEAQIQTLTKEIEKKNEKIKSLEKDVAGLKEADKKKSKQLAEAQDEQCTAYFAIGTKKELRNKNIVDRKGGFIGLGKSTVLANNSDFAAFTKIDTRNTQEIPLTGKRVKIVTPHPENSYSLEGDPKRPTSIRIINPDLFWKASRCLVIMVD